ncbi:MAG: glycosyltransferase family 4 protein [Verrucomicrobia bacterium]|nr:glycosyltransferase family 4 protein [Verrucomicrobiota bacterium]
MKATEGRFAFISGGLAFGGSTTFLLNLGSGLARLGCEVKIWCMESDSPFADDFERRNLPISWIGRRGCIYEKRIRSCLRELAGFQPAVLVANIGPEAFEVFRYARGPVTKVGIIHSDDPGVYRSLTPYFRLADYVVGVSAEICRHLREEAMVAPGRVRLINYGIEIPQLADRPPRDPECLRVLYLGRLDRLQKRVRLLEPIALHLRDQGRNFRLTIIGDGPERSWLERTIRKNGLGRWVELRHAVPYCEVPEIYPMFDVLLLPSAFEGLPLTLLESMAAGVVPVVTRLRSGSEELIDSSNGILVDVEDIAGYADAIDWLARDRRLLEQLSENAHRTINQRYSASTMAEQWLAFCGEAGYTSFDVSKILPPIGSEGSFPFTPIGRLLRRAKAVVQRLQFNASWKSGA